MGLIQSLRGTVRVELVSGEIAGALADIAQMGIPINSVKIGDALTVRFDVRREDYRRLAAVCKKRGDALRILGRKGIYWTGKSLIRRPLLLSGMAVLLAAVLYLPGRVLFVRVEGNERIPAGRILEAAEECGICFGASRREVRSERVKNALLQELPELQWAGVNTSGCVATISVREREAQLGDARKEHPEVSSIVAGNDGVILSGTVTAGTGMFQPGQAVLKGQVLISGYSDLGLTIRAERAEGEVFARTRRILEAVTPSEGLAKGENRDILVRYSLLIGKKRINLWKGSGICDGSCDRMYEEYYVTLPGEFRLPLAIVRETVTYRETCVATVPAGERESLLDRFAEAYLSGRMISGVILMRNQCFREEAGTTLLHGEYLCTEMIGRRRQEKIGE